MIAILAPVLNRPDRVKPLVKSIWENSTVVEEILFICSEGDDAEIDAVAVECSENFVVMPWQDAAQYAAKINHGFRLTQTPFVLLGADDLHFHPGWDAEAIRVAEDTGAGVIGTNDLANPAVKAGKHATHPLVRRSYIDEVGGTFDQGPGVVYFEGYSHQSVDNELVVAAKHRSQWAFAADSHIEHKHPFYDKSVPMDDTYRRGLAKGREDRMLFNRRLREFQSGR